MQGGEVEGILQQIGFLLVKAGGALIDNMAILFVIGVVLGYLRIMTVQADLQLWLPG